MSNPVSSPDSLDIAIVGMSGRFPGAPDLATFWDNLSRGVESIEHFTDDELRSAGVKAALLEDPSYVKSAPVLAAPEFFDAGFFDITPGDAELTDPQRRLLLECSWEALEDAGYDPNRYAGAIGVYAGVGLNSYAIHNLFVNRRLVDRVGELALLLHGDKDYASTFVSYKLNLTGPSINLQTACSTSLVAIHLARQSLLVGECDMALAGGSSIAVPHRVGYKYEEGNILSPDGHCRAFDSQSGGTIFGSGCGVIALKRFEDAVADHDDIRAVIKGSAVNNDGSVKVGYTAPSVEGQAAVIAQALASAGITPDTIGYVEAHGTGTELGDPIEVTALTQAYRATTSANDFCAIGSLKTNIGHLNTAAGVAGVIKTVLALQHDQIPPSLNYSVPNPRIDFPNSPFHVNTALTPWPERNTPRRAAVSSLGIGGTNAHVILEEAPPRLCETTGSSLASTRETLILSARSTDALNAALDRLASHLEAHPALDLRDVAYTLQCGRAEFAHRVAFRAGSATEAAATIRQRAGDQLFWGESTDGRPVVFMFPGQGAQALGMGRELYASLPRFRQTLDRCLDVLAPLLDVDLRQLMFSESADAAQELMQTRLAQPALFAVEYALAEQLMAWGIEPDMMIGHSLGEYVAACLANVFTLDDALRLVVERGRLMQAQPSGAMLSVTLSVAAMERWLTPAVTVAACNAPEMCVVSGPIQDIEALQQRLDAAGIGCQLLRTSHAFHSASMDAAIAPFEALVRTVGRSTPARRIISNVTGGWLTDQAALDPQYWAGHIRSTVQFGPGLATLLEAEPRALLIEVGPGRALSTLARLQARSQPMVTALPRAGASDEAEGLELAVARMWLAGTLVDWVARGDHGPTRYRVPLPTYAFERQRYWIDPVASADEGLADTDKKPDIADWFYLPSWTHASLPVLAAPAIPRNWLVFAGGVLSDDLSNALRARGDRVIEVRRGAAFARVNDDAFVLDPHALGDYRSLVETLVAEERVPRGILHLWSTDVDVDPASAPTLESFSAYQESGFYSLLFLSQVLGRFNITQAIDVVVMTAGLHAITGAEQLRPEQSTLVGVCKVIQQEYHNLTCHLVDVVPPPAGDWRYPRFVSTLIEEIHADTPELVVAYRDQHRWVQSYEPLRVEARSDVPPLVHGGMYLFTGGLVGIGLAFAEYLSSTWQANLVFLEEAGFPAEERWTQWLDQNDPMHLHSLKIVAARELRKLGGQVSVVPTGLHDLEPMAQALANAEETFGALRGIIHAPGGSSAGRIATITDSSRAECERNFTAVGRGLIVLDELTRDRPLDFRIALGSLGSILGGVGYASFGAASSFMASYAHWHNHAYAEPWQVQSWDSWKLEWTLDERIMTLIRDNLADRILPTAITQPEGLECFRRLFTIHGSGQVGISATDLPARYDRWVALKTVREIGVEKGTSASQPRPTLTSAYVAPRNSTEEAIVVIWQEMLGIAPIGMYDNFYDLGGHSLLATQVVGRLRQALGTDLSLAAMFEDPTVSGVANVVMARRAVRQVLAQPSQPSRL